MFLILKDHSQEKRDGHSPRLLRRGSNFGVIFVEKIPSYSQIFTVGGVEITSTVLENLSGELITPKRCSANGKCNPLTETRLS